MAAARQVHRRRLRASSTLDDAVFGERFHGPLVHEAGARRAGRAPPRHRVDQDPRRGRHDRRQGLAPEGHRPRPRGRAVHAAAHRRRRGLRPQAARLHRQGQPQGAPARAARRALRARRARLDRRAWTRRRSTRPPPSRPPRRSAALDGEGSVLVVLDRRRGELRQVVPQPRAASRCCTPTTWAWPT